MAQMKSTSFSRWKEYAECPLKARLKFLEKVPDPRPDPPPGKEHPFDRGSRIHELAETIVKQGFDTIPEELNKFETRFNFLHDLYKLGNVNTEMPVAFDGNWQQSDPRDFSNTKYRMIADVFCDLGDNHLLVIDHKTGRKDGNEPIHMQQGIEYLCAMYMIYPSAQKFTFEVWYLDKGDVLTATFTRNELASSIEGFKERHERLWQTTTFPPTPSQQACRFCPFKKGSVGFGKNAYAGTGHCDRNVN